MAESTEKVQINFQVSPEDAAAIDALARQDGYDKRASWIRRVVRAEVGRRMIVTALPHPAGAQVVPLINIRDDGPEAAELQPA
jgi:hypothetical protein